MRRALAALVLIAASTPATAADLPGFLGALARKAPVELTVPPQPGAPPDLRMRLAMPALNRVEITTSGGGKSVAQSLIFKPATGADIQADYTVAAPGQAPMTLSCAGALVAADRLDLGCWPPTLFADRGAMQAPMRVGLSTGPAGPSYTVGVANGQAVTYAAKTSSAPNAAPAAPTPQARLADALRQIGAYRLTPSSPNNFVGQSTASGKTFPTILALDKVAGLDFHLSRTIASLGVLQKADEVDDWSFHSIGADPANPAVLRWTTQQSKPLKAGYGKMELSCLGRTNGVTTTVICWEPNILELFGQKAENVAVSFELQSTPTWSLHIMPGLNNLFTTDAKTDLQTKPAS